MVFNSNFTSGFAAGAISSVISSSIQGKINKHLKDAITIASGGLSGGISSSIAGGNFWRGAKQGVITSGLNHVAHSVAKSLKKDPLKRFKKKAKSLDKWTERYEDKSYIEIIYEDGTKQGMPAGPIQDYRYVTNPIDGNVMDMRHVSVVGYGMGSNNGELVEFTQWAVGDPSNSAYDAQDYYSNKIGSYFGELRSMGTWRSDSWAYDFQRFIQTQYRAVSPVIINYAIMKYYKYEEYQKN